MKPTTFLLIFLLILITTPPVHADGGSVIAQAESGSFRVTLFAAPSRLRAGPADLSALVQNAQTGAPILDAAVIISLDAQPAAADAKPAIAWAPPCCSLSGAGSLQGIAATHSAARNKLLYAANLTLPASGLYQLTAVITTADGQARLTAPLRVDAPLPAAAAYWPLLLLPPIGIAGYALRTHSRKR